MHFLTALLWMESSGDVLAICGGSAFSSLGTPDRYWKENVCGRLPENGKKMSRGSQNDGFARVFAIFIENSLLKSFLLVH